MSDLDYYSDSSQWGNYQYITIEDIINNYLMSSDPDDYTSNVQRFKIVYQARRALREFYYDVLREIRAISLELSPSLQVTLPSDYVGYVRISWVDEFGELHPMAIDNKVDISKEYLQDHKYNVLFDSNGCILTGDTRKADIPDTTGFEYQLCSSSNFTPNVDGSEIYKNGKYRIDKSSGVIEFSSDVKGKHIVLEYISDGFFTSCDETSDSELRVHKFAEAAVINFIYYELIKKRRNVPYNEKRRAEKEYWNSRRLTKMRINAIRKDELLQVFKGSSKWIK